MERSAIGARMFHRFAMATFIFCGRLLVVVGVLWFFQRLIVDPKLDQAIVLGLLYGGGMVGLGKTFIRMGHLGRRLGPSDSRQG